MIEMLSTGPEKYLMGRETKLPMFENGVQQNVLKQSHDQNTASLSLQTSYWLHSFLEL